MLGSSSVAHADAHNYRRLALAILVQAVWDVVMLQRAGVIKKGAAIPAASWPVGRDTYGYRKQMCINNFYFKSGHVQELCDFVTGAGLGGLLELVGCNVDQSLFIDLLHERRVSAVDLINTCRSK